MDDLDLRDLAGRAGRFVIAAVLGTVSSIELAMLLPRRDHFADHWHSCLGGGDGADAGIVIAGGIALTLGYYAALQAIVRRRRVAPIPRAVLVRR